MKKLTINKVILGALCFWMFIVPAATIFGTEADEKELTVQTNNLSNNAEIDSNSAKLPKMDIMFVLDNSGSMQKNDPMFITREVVTNFLDHVIQGYRFGMVIFDNDARLVEPLVDIKDPEVYARFIRSLDRLDLKGQFTNIPAGVERAIYELKTNAGKDIPKVIILLTDGIVDTGNRQQDLEDEKWLKEQLTQESKRCGIRIFGVAFTDKADFRLIQTLASMTNGEYFRAYNAEAIPEVFKKIKDIIIEPEDPIVTLDKLATETSRVGEKKKMPGPQIDTAEPPASAQKSLEALKQKETHGTKLPLAKSVEKGITLSPYISYLIAVLLFLVLFFLFRNKRKNKNPQALKADKQGQEESPAIGHPLAQAELIDVENIINSDSISIALNKKAVNIGRDSSNDIVIPEKIISSLHATIEYRDGHYYLEDNRSTNGTSINNEVIKENSPVRLKSGDKIHFAKYEFRFLLHAQAPHGETVMVDRNLI